MQAFPRITTSQCDRGHTFFISRLRIFVMLFSSPLERGACGLQRSRGVWRLISVCPHTPKQTGRYAIHQRFVYKTEKEEGKKFDSEGVVGV